MWRYRINTFYSGNSGEYGSILFAGDFTGDASFRLFPRLSGSNRQRCQHRGTWHQFAWRFAGYGQDDWRITPTLTLNLGSALRSTYPLGGTQQPSRRTSGCTPERSSTPVKTATAAPSITRCTACRTSNRAWASPGRQPVLGRQEVLRGAYTISSYLEGTGTNLRLPRNPPFTPTEVTATYNSPTYQTQQGPGGAVAGDPFAGAVMRVWDKTVQPAMDQQWNLTVQTPGYGQQLTFQVGYVGQQGHAPDGSDAVLAATLNNGVVGPYTLLPPDNPTLINDIFTCSGTCFDRVQRPTTRSKPCLQKRLSNGLEGQVAYTWSHCLTNNSGYYGTWGAPDPGDSGVAVLPEPVRPAWRLRELLL